MITFVWAEDENGVIGYKGKLPWKLPSDMQFFKKVTSTGAVVMGRRTYESIPHPPLKGRENIILTRNNTYNVEKDVKVFHTKQEVLEFAKNSPKEVHVIGGSSIFSMFQDDVNKLYRTVIHHSFDGDTHMVPINWKEWELKSRTAGIRDEKNLYDHDFEVYVRKEI